MNDLQICLSMLVSVMCYELIRRFFYYGRISFSTKDKLFEKAASKIFVDSSVKSYNKLQELREQVDVDNTVISHLGDPLYDVYEIYETWSVEDVITEIDELYKDYLNIYKHDIY